MNTFVVIGTGGNGALKPYPFINIYPIGGNDLGHGCTKIQSLLPEFFEIPLYRLVILLQCD
jgi:hypothetical protein